MWTNCFTHIDLKLIFITSSRFPHYSNIRRAYLPPYIPASYTLMNVHSVMNATVEEVLDSFSVEFPNTWGGRYTLINLWINIHFWLFMTLHLKQVLQSTNNIVSKLRLLIIVYFQDKTQFKWWLTGWVACGPLNCLVGRWIAVLAWWLSFLVREKLYLCINLNFFFISLKSSFYRKY